MIQRWEGYSREERAELGKVLAAGGTPRCPQCEVEMARSEVSPGRSVPYVRRRTWLICPACKRSAALDID